MDSTQAMPRPKGVPDILQKKTFHDSMAGRALYVSFGKNPALMTIIDGSKKYPSQKSLFCNGMTGQEASRFCIAVHTLRPFVP
jgi:hypothetical protein